MRFLILLIIAMALLTLPAYGQMSTAPSVSAFEKVRGTTSRVSGFDPRQFSKPDEIAPCFYANAYPDCIQSTTSQLSFLALLLKPLLDSGEIQVIDLEGLKKLLQPDAKDARPLLVNFWATWCDPCREEFPDLVKIDADYRGKNLNFVTVSLDDVSEIGTEVPKFLKQMKATMPTVLLNVNDPEPAIKSVDAGWDGQLPATFLYDKDGKVVFRHFGKIKPDELRAAIDKEVSRKQ
ncbi:MAG TPA: TlpA disulfide reductase family protein [Pyrinomonadaceae bacterium]|nr:TlpA disulfide reductase family protein [Pyrinomonadaceae bacterium]